MSDFREELSISRIHLPTYNNDYNRDRPRRVVFYGRVSSEHEAQLAALENQVEWYDEQAKHHPNWTVLRKYIDEGITGTQAKKRDSFMQMIEDAKEGCFDLIVTREVPRFARNTVDTLLVTRELKKYGVEVYFVFENIWTMDGEGEFRLTIMASIAQDESRKTSERVKAGQAISRQKGVLYGTGNILGYNRVGDTYVIDEEQAETVRMIYDLYLQGNGFKNILNELTRQKRKNASGKVKWDCTTISRILHNATYKGYIGYLKSWRDNFLDQKIIINRNEDTYMYVKGNFEPIISEEIWEKCKELREEKVKLKLTKSGGIVKKGEKRCNNIWVRKLRCKCGFRFCMEKWHVNKSGVTYGYRCYNVINNGKKTAREQAGLNSEGYCNMTTIADWKMDLMIWYILKNLNFSVDDISEFVYESYDDGCKVSVDAYADVIEDLNEKLEKERRKLENITDMRVCGEISKEEYSSGRFKINSNIIALQQRIDEIKSKVRTDNKGPQRKMSIEEINGIIEEQLNFSTPSVDKEVIEAFVRRVIPDDSYSFNWYMAFLKRVKEEDYVCVKEFTIPYESAKAFRKMRGEMLRPNQYTELKVKVFM